MDKCIVKKSDNSFLNFREIWTSENFNINWCDMCFERESTIEVYDSGEFIELYFQFNGLSETRHDGGKIEMLPNSQGVFYVNNYTMEHKQFKKEEKPLSFLEIRLGVDIVKNMFPEELWKKQHFMKKLFTDTSIPVDPMKPISPHMKSIIWNMCNSPFKGIMLHTCLEAQITELFLLQAESHTLTNHNALRKKDHEIIVAAKDFIDNNYLQKLHVADLAKEVGTNQQSLRSGFKTLFNTTIFDYYNNLRMEHARHLLLDKGELVADVADAIGYKNPQHFTIAFKKKFGTLPSELKKQSNNFTSS